MSSAKSDGNSAPGDAPASAGTRPRPGTSTAAGSGSPSGPSPRSGPASTLRGPARFLYNILTSGTFDEYSIGQRGRFIFLNGVMGVGMVTYGAFSTIALGSGNLPLGFSSLAGVLLIFAGFVYLRKTRNIDADQYYIIAIISVLFAWLVWSGGEGGSGVLWALSYPLAVLFILGARAGNFWALGMWVFIGVVALVPGLNPAGYTALFAIRILGSYLFIWLFALTYAMVRQSTQKELEETNDRLKITTDELTMEKSQTDAILRSVNEGIFLMESDGSLGSAYSAHSESIFEVQGLEGQRLQDLLGPHLNDNAKQALGDWIPMLFDKSLSRDLIMDINPLSEERLVFFNPDGTQREKVVRAGFQLVGGAQSRALCTLQDVSDEVRLQKQLASEEGFHKKSMEKLFQIIHVEASLMGEFISEAEVELETINNYLRDPSVSGDFIIPLMYQGVHGIKGNALLLGLQELGTVVHDVESEIKEYLDTESSWKDLLRLTLGIGRIQQEIEELKSFIRKVVEYRSGEGSDGKGLMERALVRLAHRDAETGGKLVDLELSRFNSEQIPPRLRKKVKDCAVQLVRNAVHHGLELPGDRQDKGKKSTGCIEIALGVVKNNLVLTLKDDGKGLDLAAIKDRLRLDGGNPDALSQHDLIMSIFTTGFSTAEKETLAAGRGAGLALVKQIADQASGGIGLRFWPGQGTEFQVRFPLAKEEIDTWTRGRIAPGAPVVVDSVT